jgi:ferredoxin-NADP reductase
MQPFLEFLVGPGVLVANPFAGRQGGDIREVVVAEFEVEHVEVLAEALDVCAVYYLCGPLPFMQAIRTALIERDVAARDIQYEVFGPDLWQADTE